jgi:hypothetical protein
MHVINYLAKKFRKNCFLLASLRSLTKISGPESGSASQRSGSVPKCHISATLDKDVLDDLYRTLNVG